MLSKPIAFYLQASLILFYLAGSSAPTPLYPVYQAQWGFSPITVTVVFGIYALTVLATLLVFGSLSDFVGRRPVLLVSTLLQAVAMGVFITAHGLSDLIVGRIVQGVATGAAASAVGAGMLDIDRTRGTVANAMGPMLGTATGGLLSGLLVQYLPAPTQLVYGVLAGVFVLQSIGVWFMPETASRRPGALASLKPRLEVPSHLRRPLLLAAPALVGTWALAGFYGSLGPTLVRRLMHSSSLVVGGLALFAFAGTGALTALLTRNRASRSLMTFGNAALALGVGLTLLAVSLGSPALFFVGTMLSGVGFAGGFQGAIRSVLPLAATHERASVLSVMYVLAYLAMGLPAIAGGVRAVHGGGVFETAREYGFGVIALAGLALLGSLRQTTPKPSVLPA